MWIRFNWVSLERQILRNVWIIHIRLFKFSSWLLLNSIKEPFYLVIKVIIVNRANAVESIEFIVMAAYSCVWGGRIIFKQQTIVFSAAALWRWNSFTKTNTTFFTRVGLTCCIIDLIQIGLDSEIIIISVLTTRINVSRTCLCSCSSIVYIHCFWLFRSLMILRVVYSSDQSGWIFF